MVWLLVVTLVVGFYCRCLFCVVAGYFGMFRLVIMVVWVLFSLCGLFVLLCDCNVCVNESVCVC